MHPVHNDTTQSDMPSAEPGVGIASSAISSPGMNKEEKRFSLPLTLDSPTLCQGPSNFSETVIFQQAPVDGNSCIVRPALRVQMPRGPTYTTPTQVEDPFGGTDIRVVPTIEEKLKLLGDLSTVTIRMPRTGSRFLSIPPEIRTLIYRYAFSNASLIFLQERLQTRWSSTQTVKMSASSPSRYPSDVQESP